MACLPTLVCICWLLQWTANTPYAQAEGYSFDLLADFWPHGKVAASYGVFDPVRGMARRSTFLISAAGIIVDFFSTPAGQARPLGRYVQALGLL